MAEGSTILEKLMMLFFELHSLVSYKFIIIKGADEKKEFFWPYCNACVEKSVSTDWISEKTYLYQPSHI